MNGICPPGEDLQRLLADQLSAGEEQLLESHVMECEGCRQRLDELTGLASSILPTPISDRTGSPTPGGVLVRLANSSRLGLPLPEDSQAKHVLSSSARRSSVSNSVLASGRFLRRQVWTWPLISALLLSVAGWWVNRSVESTLRQQRINELTTVLDADVAALHTWMDKQLVGAQTIAADEQIKPLVQELLSLSNGTPAVRKQLVQAQAQDAIRSQLEASLRRHKFTGFVVVSPEGIAVADDADAPIGEALTGYRKEFFDRVVSGQGAVSRPFLNPQLRADGHGELRTNLPCMIAAAPIVDEDDRPIAAIGLQILPEGQFTQILRVARSGRTGETYAFDRSGVLLSESRFDDQLKQIGLLVDRPDNRAILNVEMRDPGVNMVSGERPKARRSDQPLTRMAQSATQGSSGFDVDGYRDYRGVMVVGAWQWLKEYDFGVATEIDVDEAFAPVYTLRRTFGVLMGLLGAATLGIFLAMLLIARQQRELHHAALAAQQFGQYTLVEKLGAGGMGTVYRARHALLRRPTAIKLLHPEMVSHEAIARFEREVQLTSGLSHPNTVAIYDYGRTPSGVFYYAMEYLEGINLDDLVKEYGPLPEARAMHILRQVCSSLAEAHAAGLVHRDVKPANIVLTVRGGQHDFVKVLDFGLARLAGNRDQAHLTSNNMMAGTPFYVSPEAVTQPQRIDSRADVYAIAAVAYFLLSGAPVFNGSSAAEICLRHITATPQPLSARTEQPVSPALEQLLLRCLAKSPADRPKDAAELLRLLEICPVSGQWASTDADRWWANRDRLHAAATQVLPAPEMAAPGSNRP